MGGGGGDGTTKVCTLCCVACTFCWAACCCSQASRASASARADSVPTVCSTLRAESGPPSRVHTQPWDETHRPRVDATSPASPAEKARPPRVVAQWLPEVVGQSMPAQLFLHQLQLGPMKNFVYLVGTEGQRDVVVVDPAWDVDAHPEDLRHPRQAARAESS